MSARREDISNALVYTVRLTGEGRPKTKRGGQRRNVVTILRNYDVTFACPHTAYALVRFLLSADAGSGENIEVVGIVYTSP